MFRAAIVTVGVMCMVPGIALAGSTWGQNDKGVFRVGDEAIRLFAISYEGSLNDSQRLNREVQMAMDYYNRVNLTHRDNDHNGGFYQTNLGTDKVFVIGWFNVQTGERGYMATIPGSQQVRMNDGSFHTYDRGGWFRRSFLANGTPVHLQLGNQPNVVKWQMGL